MNRPVQLALFIPTPFAGAERSGVLRLWAANQAWRCECSFRTDIEGSVLLLQSAFGQMLADRRARCRNREALEALYLRLQASVDYHVTATWLLAGAHREVETHPILGSGRNGRIWLLHDATVQESLAEELRMRAHTDAVTGLPNRRHFFEIGPAATTAAAASPVLSVLLLDIDHFKSINDGFGHPVGDEVLRELANRCCGQLRGSDLMARIGGEEFAVLLPETRPAEAGEIAERLRLEVGAAPVATQGGAIAMTISLGRATFSAFGESFEGLLKRADAALYEAKRGGRNRLAFGG